jgi:ribosomal protein S18 acetylase RimI-like enzyme
VRAIVASTGFFSAAEIEVAVELVRERRARGPESGYHFVFVEVDGRVVAYACFGPIACTIGSFDLYWIAVLDSYRGLGFGRKLMAEAERRIAEMGGRRVYVETSSRPQYDPTRGFYVRCGYAPEAVLRDYYAPGDDKVVFVREVRIDARLRPRL